MTMGQMRQATPIACRTRPARVQSPPSNVSPLFRWLGAASALWSVGLSQLSCCKTKRKNIWIAGPMALAITWMFDMSAIVAVRVSGGVLSATIALEVENQFCIAWKDQHAFAEEEGGLRFVCAPRGVTGAQKHMPTTMNF